jgi:hypothetical protein
MSTLMLLLVWLNWWQAPWRTVRSVLST